jgi:hypothetical protein
MKDIVYTRKYTDQTGVKRKEYINVGMLFEKEGRMSIKLKGFINLAALQNEKGEVWLNVYEPKPKETKENKEKSEKPIYKGQSTVDALTDALLRSKDPSQEVQGTQDISEDTPF